MDCEKGGKNMPQGMVHIENLVKRYGDLTALNHLDRPSAVCCPC